jgi:hypothetical protein
MPRLIPAPTVIQAAGNKPKRIEEYAGKVNSGHQSVSVARMVSPGEWVRYSTPLPDGAEYVAVCVPAFSPETVHRDKD